MNVILIAAVSADGKIASASDQSSLDWTSKEDLKFFVQKTKECGVVVMGRKTFETIGKPLKDRLVIVMTHDVKAHSPMEGVEFTSESPQELVERLTREGKLCIAVAGGSQIYSQFLQAGLVTELFLTVEPVLFGSGVPLATGFDRMKLVLEDATRLGEQAMLLHYRIP